MLKEELKQEKKRKNSKKNRRNTHFANCCCSWTRSGGSTVGWTSARTPTTCRLRRSTGTRYAAAVGTSSLSRCGWRLGRLDRRFAVIVGIYRAPRPEVPSTRDQWKRAQGRRRVRAVHRSAASCTRDPNAVRRARNGSVANSIDRPRSSECGRHSRSSQTSDKYVVPCFPTIVVVVSRFRREPENVFRFDLCLVIRIAAPSSSINVDLIVSASVLIHIFSPYRLRCQP